MGTDLGLLTTTFTPPNDCSLFSVQLYDSLNTFIGQYLPHWPSAGRCLPSGFPTGVWDEDLFYSPGVCPSGWKANQNPAGTSGETTIRCCPPDYTSVTSLEITSGGGTEIHSDGCYMTITSPTTVTAVVLTGDDFITYVTGPSAGSPVTVTTSTDYVIQPRIVLIGGLNVRFRSGDFHSITQTSQSLPTFETSLSSSTSTVPHLESSPNGLSSGAKIGIGVGIPIVVFVLAMIAFCMFYCRRKRSNLIAFRSANGDDVQYDYSSKPELPSNSHEEFNGEVYKGKSELEAASTEVTPSAEPFEPQHCDLPPELHGQASAPVLDVPPITVAKSDGDIENRDLAELAAGTVTQHADTLVVPPAISSPRDEQFQNSGPLPSPSELFPIIDTQKEDLDEEELLDQEQRLKGRRELLAEKEKLAIEEGRLRRIRAKKGNSSKSGG